MFCRKEMKGIDSVGSFFYDFTYSIKNDMKWIMDVERIRNLLNIDLFEEIQNKKSSFSVAIMDSGIVLHPDLDSSKLVFCDFVNGLTAPYDDYGHGTHIAGIIGGNGMNRQGKYRGIYPNCSLICIKILDKNGNGSAEQMCNAMEWILKNKEKYKIRIVNISISLNQSVATEKSLQLLHLVNKMCNNGILVVAAAGNNGPSPGTISKIADLKDVIAVGCYDGEYKSKFGQNCEEYSACGPGTSSFRKPDIVAPGTDIVSCSNQYSYGRFYERKSGTSMATAVVSGCVALTLTANPNITSEEMRILLRKNALDQNKPWNKQGWGMINVKGMIKSAMFS